MASKRMLRKFATQRKIRQFDRRKRLQQRRADLSLQRQRQALRKRWRNLKSSLRRTNALLFWQNRYCHPPVAEESREQN